MDLLRDRHFGKDFQLYVSHPSCPVPTEAKETIYIPKGWNLTLQPDYHALGILFLHLLLLHVLGSSGSTSCILCMVESVASRSPGYTSQEFCPPTYAHELWLLSQTITVVMEIRYFLWP